jgi:GAF domain
MADQTPTRQTVYIDQIRGDTQRCLRDLLDENAKLRALVGELEGENRPQGLAARLVENEAEGRRVAEQLAVVERQSADLANLYVATYRLHATLHREDVVVAIHEIVTNLIGCEEFVILELTPDGRALSLVSWSGVDAETIHGISIDHGIVGATIQRGDTFVSDDLPGRLGPRGELPITACVAMRLDQRVTGVLVLFRMLEQKVRLETVDRELLDLMATHAASALFMTRAYAKELPTRRPPAHAQ